MTKPLRDCDGSEIDRRQLLQTLGLTASAALAFMLPKTVAAFAQPAQIPGANQAFPVTSVNHLAVGTPDYVRSQIGRAHV